MYLRKKKRKGKTRKIENEQFLWAKHQIWSKNIFFPKFSKISQNLSNLRWVPKNWLEKISNQR
jgi:hypothetical protein